MKADSGISPEEAIRRLEIARRIDRPRSGDYIDRLIRGWLEVKTDPNDDDPVIITGLGSFSGRTVAIVGQQKPKTMDANDQIAGNFGMPSPPGYRNAMRMMEFANQHGFPVITFIDTPGALPTMEAEEEGQAKTIARTLALMARLKLPTIAVVIGEGGSGGAVALGLASKVLQLENAFYSVISPESAVPILWKEEAQRYPTGIPKDRLDELTAKVTANFNPFAENNKKLGVIDIVVPEPEGGAHNDYDLAAAYVGRAIADCLDELLLIEPDQLVRDRRDKFLNMGVYIENGKVINRAIKESNLSKPGSSLLGRMSLRRDN